MSKIKIKHFGPIREGFTENDGWMDINKVTVFIGNQGSGKSTVAKLISSFMWLEKALIRGDADEAYFKKDDFFTNNILSYHRLQDYLNVKFPAHTYLGYEGIAYKFEYIDGGLEIFAKTYEFYPLPQIMYVPAERNFLSYVKSAKELKLISESFQEFLSEFENAKGHLSDYLKLPIKDTYLKYDKLNDTLSLQGNDYNNLKLTDASSGFQSLVPLYIVSWYLANTISNRLKNNNSSMSNEELQRFRNEISEIYTNETLTQEQKRAAITVLSNKFNKSAFINIVEEPEQNLFPSSQWRILQSLVGFNNYAGSSKLIMTTHSPYIINYLSILIQGMDLYRKINLAPIEFHNEFLSTLRKEMDTATLLDIKNISIYEMNEETGIISMLSAKYGIPSDNNYLNNQLKKGNMIFDRLLEIEESLPI